MKTHEVNFRNFGTECGRVGDSEIGKRKTVCKRIGFKFEMIDCGS